MILSLAKSCFFPILAPALAAIVTFSNPACVLGSCFRGTGGIDRVFEVVDIRSSSDVSDSSHGFFMVER